MCGYHRSRFEMEISLYLFYQDPMAPHFPLVLEGWNPQNRPTKLVSALSRFTLLGLAPHRGY